jgi:hypothetical protein
MYVCLFVCLKKNYFNIDSCKYLIKINTFIVTNYSGVFKIITQSQSKTSNR